MIQKIRNFLGLEDKQSSEKRVEKTYGVNFINFNKDENFWSYGGEGQKQELFKEVSEAQVVLEKKITFLKSAKILIKNSKGDVVQDLKLENLLKSVNPFQTIYDILGAWAFNLEVYGEAYIYANKTGVKGVYPLSMFVLPSQHITSSYASNWYKQIDRASIVSAYTYNSEPLEFENVQHTRNVSNTDFKCNVSKIDLIHRDLELISSIGDLKNTVYKKKGAIGILSSGLKDGDGGIPLGTKERERIHAEYERTYGTSPKKSSIIITDTALKWEAMGFPLKDFDLETTRLASYLISIDAFGMDKNVFSFIGGSTYENLKQGMSSVYNNTIIPMGERFANEITKLLELEAKGLRIELDYSHLDFLKSDEKSEAETQAIQLSNINLMLQNQLITIDEAKKLLQSFDIVK